jgi:hypothetical protein
MTNDVPKPIIAMPTDSALVRALAEECNNTLDGGANGPTRASVTLDPIPMPTGETATIRCSRSAKGALHVSVTIRAPKAAR